MLMFFLAVALAATRATTLAERCAAADAVVVAEVTGAEARPGQSLPIETGWDLAGVEVVRGEAVTRVWTPGGALAGLRWTVSEAPELRVDHRYLLFLRRDGLEWRVMGVDGAVPVPHPSAEALDAARRACDAT